MSSPSRRKNSSVAGRLGEEPFEFQFLQAVRLLERSAYFNKSTDSKGLKPVAGFLPPTSEILRFRSQSSLNFPASEIVSIKKHQQTEQWEMVVAMMGLTGSMGVLPYHYTELILQRLKLKDRSLSHFFDLFNHRTLSLFYQASVKYRLGVEYERKQMYPPIISERDTHTQVLLSLIGLGTRHLDKRQYTQDESLIYYAGLLTQQVRSSSGLAGMLQHHFGIPVQINEFVGQWQELIDDVRTTLPSRQQAGRNNCLGRSAMLGRHGWFAQGKFRIILGPLNREQLNRFAPGTSTLKALNEMVQFYTGMEHDYDFVIRVKRADIPSKIKMDKRRPSIIGWNTWLSSKPLGEQKAQDNLDIVVSGGRIR